MRIRPYKLSVYLFSYNDHLQKNLENANDIGIQRFSLTASHNNRFHEIESLNQSYHYVQYRYSQGLLPECTSALTRTYKHQVNLGFRSKRIRYNRHFELAELNCDATTTTALEEKFNENPLTERAHSDEKVDCNTRLILRRSHSCEWRPTIK